MKKLFLLSIILISGFATSDAYAGAPYCNAHPSGPYCSYSGRVVKAYINTVDQILLYFDTPMDLAQPSSVGITGVTSTTAAIYRISDNPEFAKMLYASMLQAQARGAKIIVQMRGVYGGHLIIDRIWVYED